MKTKKAKKTLIVTVEFPLEGEELDHVESNIAAGYSLKESLVGEFVKVKSGLYENFLCGCVSVKSK